MAMLEVKNLHTYFKTRKGIVKAVNDVSYVLEPGKTVGIVGESGSGKSVSAMSILQLLDGNGYIAEGEVFFEDRDLTKLSQQEMYEIRGNKISVIFQEPMTSLNPVFTVKKQLSEPFMIHQNMSKKQAEAKAVCDNGCFEMREFIFDMPRVMAAADLIMCRAGASTLAELTYMGKPAIIVPSPNVTNNHQEKNARVLEKAGGAKVMLEGQFDADSMLAEIRNLLADESQLEEMSKVMAALAVPDACDKICDTILEIVR